MKCLFTTLVVFTAFFLPSNGFSQANDTFLLRGCARYWANDHPVNNFRMTVNLDRPDPLADQGFTGSASPDSSCSEVTVITTAVPPGTRVWVYGEKLDSANDYRNGVSICDLILMNKHILGLEPLPSYALVAADINSSRSINTLDIVELRKLLLGIYTELPNSPSWRVLSPGCSFPNPANPFSTNCQGFPADTLPALENAPINFAAVKVGDVDGDYSFDGPYHITTTQAPVDLYLPDQNLTPGTIITVPLYHKGIFTTEGFQFQLRHDTAVLEIQDILPSPGSSQDNWAIFSAAGLLRNISTYFLSNYVPDTLANLRFLVKSNGLLSQSITLDSSGFASLYVESCGSFGGFHLKFDGITGVSNPLTGFRVAPANPNPFSDHTAVEIMLDVPASVQLEVTDLSGRRTYARTDDLPAGTHSLEIPGQALPNGSIGFYRVSAGGASVVGKLVRE